MFFITHSHDTTLNTNNPNLITKNFESFGDSLKYLLKNRGLKQKFLVEKAKKGADEISRYVNDKVLPHPDTQNLLGDILGVSFEQDTNGKWSYSETHSHINEPVTNYNMVSQSRPLSYSERERQMEGLIEELRDVANDIEATILKKKLDEKTKLLIFDGIAKRLNDINQKL